MSQDKPRFIRRGGRIIPIGGKRKKVGSGERAYFKGSSKSKGYHEDMAFKKMAKAESTRMDANYQKSVFGAAGLFAGGGGSASLFYKKRKLTKRLGENKVGAIITGAAIAGYIGGAMLGKTDKKKMAKAKKMELEGHAHYNTYMRKKYKMEKK